MLLEDLWPTPAEVDDVVSKVLGRDQFTALVRVAIRRRRAVGGARRRWWDPLPLAGGLHLRAAPAVP